MRKFSEKKDFSERENPKQWFLHGVAYRFLNLIQYLNPIQYLNQSNFWMVMSHVHFYLFLIMLFLYMHLLSLYNEQYQTLIDCSHNLKDCSGFSNQFYLDLKNNLNNQK